jgi:HEAT repeat protein
VSSDRIEIARLGHRSDLTRADRARIEEATRSDDPATRAVALGALRRAAPDRAGAAVAAALADPDARVRRRAAQLAAGLGASVPAGRLVGLLDDDDPLVADAAAWALGEHPRPGRTAVAALARTATDHRDPLVREAAVAALGAIGDPAGLPSVLHACGDKPAIRRRAVLALAPFEGPEVDAALARARDDRDWQVRQAAEDLTFSRGGP